MAPSVFYICSELYLLLDPRQSVDIDYRTLATIKYWKLFASPVVGFIVMPKDTSGFLSGKIMVQSADGSLAVCPLDDTAPYA